MLQKAHSPQEILERCIVENSSDAWEAFFSQNALVVRRVYHAHAEAAWFPDFESWFPGWLYYERKLHAAYRALQAKIRSGECLTLDSQQRYLANYLASIVRAAAAEFCSERRPSAPRQVPDAVLSAVPAADPPEPDDLRARLLSVLPHLPPDLRVPFWLRYYQVFGPLSAEDAAWVAERSGLTVECAAEVVAEEAESNLSHHKPLSSEFIGCMLNIPPCADGRYSTVDQRVRRAIVRIREHLAQAAEEGDE
jgi:DNA-directed RNA polymerase specialized sigma24 family protein